MADPPSGKASDLQVLCKVLFDDSLWLSTDRGSYVLATLENVNSRDAGDAVLSGDALVLVNVDLYNVYLFSVLFSNLIQYWTKLAARTAPLCPEIDDDWLFGIQNFALEGCFSYCFCVAHERQPLSEKTIRR